MPPAYDTPGGVLEQTRGTVTWFFRRVTTDRNFRSAEGRSRIVQRAGLSQIVTLTVALTSWGASAASAQSATPAPLPQPPTILPAPAPPTSALGRSLGNAYRSIVGTAAVNPAAVQRASFAYAQALQRARSGDVSGALAAAAQAQAEAISGAAARSLPAGTAAKMGQPGTTLVPPSGVMPPTSGIPIVDNAGAGLSPELRAARNEILLASQLTRRPLTSAKADYRAALGAYHSGNRARSRRQAKAAFNAAAEALSPNK